ncbi:hypothetical protein GC106_49220, partial [Kibdelosporangium sp. 4NS15]
MKPETLAEARLRLRRAGLQVPAVALATVMAFGGIAAALPDFASAAQPSRPATPDPDDQSAMKKLRDYYRDGRARYGAAFDRAIEQAGLKHVFSYAQSVGTDWAGKPSASNVAKWATTNWPSIRKSVDGQLTKLVPHKFLESQVKDARTRVDAFQKDLDELRPKQGSKGGPTPKRGTAGKVRQTRADLARAETDLAKAQQALDRYQQLKKQEAQYQQRAKDARTAYERDQLRQRAAHFKGEAKKVLDAYKRGGDDKGPDEPGQQARPRKGGSGGPGSTGAQAKTPTTNVPQGKKSTTNVPQGKQGSTRGTTGPGRAASIAKQEAIDRAQAKQLAPKKTVSPTGNGRRTTASRVTTPKLPTRAGWARAGTPGQGAAPPFSIDEERKNRYLPTAYGLAETLYTAEISGTDQDKRWLDDTIRNLHLPDPKKRATFLRALRDTYRPQLVQDGNGNYVYEFHPIRQKWEKYIHDTYGPKKDPDQARDAMIADKKATSQRETAAKKAEEAKKAQQARNRDAQIADRKFTAEQETAAEKKARKQAKNRDAQIADRKETAKRETEAEQKRQAKNRDAQIADRKFTAEQETAAEKKARKQAKNRDAQIADRKETAKRETEAEQKRQARNRDAQIADRKFTAEQETAAEKKARKQAKNRDAQIADRKETAKRETEAEQKRQA